MRTLLVKFIRCVALLTALSSYSYANGSFNDTTRAYAVPTLTKTPKGNVALSWTEKDQAGTVYFFWAESTDKGKTFGDKKLIYSAAGVGNSRLMRPKLLFQPNGTAVAVFALRGPEPASAEQTPPQQSARPKEESHEHGGGHGHDAHAQANASQANASQNGPRKDGPPGGGRPRDLQIVFCTSADGGNTWTQPTPVHADKAPNIVRGFFDATVLANGEIGVAYLNDIQGKAHQRDLRFVTSTNGRFSTERILDPFVCECCNISLLVDPKGALHMYYRENADNIRDIAKLISTDNGATFSKPQILFKDNWQINGCPHSGPTSSAGTGSPLIAWFSGSQDSPGIRVVTQEGKRLFVLDDPTAKNAYLVSAPKSSVLLWEQSQPLESGPVSVIAFKSINGEGNPTTQFVKNTQNGTNASGLVIDNQLVVAYEKRNANNKNSLEWARIDL